MHSIYNYALFIFSASDFDVDAGVQHPSSQPRHQAGVRVENYLYFEIKFEIISRKLHNGTEHNCVLQLLQITSI